MRGSLGACEVLVIGGGLAGLAAGLRAAELGRKVTVLEKGEDESYACNSRFSGGVIHVSYTDPKSEPATLLRAMQEATSNDLDLEQGHAMAGNAGRTIDWLLAHRAKFMRMSLVPWQRWCMAPPRQLGYGLDWKGRGPDVLLQKLAASLRSAGGQVKLGIRARHLSLYNDSIIVKATRQAEEIEMHAGAVVIADGGYQGNAELFRRFIGPNPDLVCQRGAGTGQGDGLLMAEAVGAALIGMGRFYGHVLHREALSNPNLWPYPQCDDLVAGSLIVNSSGRRFIDEGIGGIVLANRLARCDDPARGFVVFDHEMWATKGTKGRIPLNPYLEKAGGTLYRADTIADLADKIGVDASGLADTIVAWNLVAASGSWSDISPPRSVDPLPGKLESMTPSALRKPPYYAFPLCPAITNVMGGISVDGQMRVRREDGSVISRLFAAGAATGGLEGGGEVGYTGGLSKAAVFGLIAGESAAAAVKS